MAWRTTITMGIEFLVLTGVAVYALWDVERFEQRRWSIRQIAANLILSATGSLGFVLSMNYVVGILRW